MRLLMGKFMRAFVFLIVLGAIAGGIYFIGERKYVHDYQAVIKLLDEALVLAKKGGGELALQKAKRTALESQRFLEAPLTRWMNDSYSQAFLKARLHLLLSRSYYEMGEYGEDSSLTEQALQIVSSIDIRNRSALAGGALAEIGFFQKEFIDKINQYSAHYSYARGAQYLEKLISIMKKRGASNYPEGETLKQSLPYFYSVLGKLYRNQQKWIEAKAAYEKALSAAEGISPVKGPFHARTYWQLGFIHLKQKQYAESEGLLKQALEWMTNSKKPDDAVLSEIYHNLAEVYKAEGKADLAKQFFDKSLEWHEKTFGEKSPKLLHVLIDYSLYLKGVGEAQKAKLLEDRGRLIEAEAARGVASPE